MNFDIGHLAESSCAATPRPLTDLRLDIAEPPTSTPPNQHTPLQSAPQLLSQNHKTEPIAPVKQIFINPPSTGTLPELDCRLKAIAAMVPADAIVADVGTDHGYLMAYLARQGNIRSGFACDINPKPLEKAAAALISVGVSHLVKTCLCDGLSGLQGEPLTHVVIAGMGGDLIWKILEDAPERRRETFLLQPMTKAHHLRSSLGKNGFTVLRETAVVSGRFVYTVMEAVYTGIYRQPTMVEAYLGQLLIDKTPEAVLYCGKVGESVTKKIEGLERSSRSESLREEIENYRCLLEYIKERIT